MAIRDRFRRGSDIPRNIQQQQRLRVSSLLFFLFAIILLTGSIYLGVLVFRQMSVLENNVEVTESIINANVRTLSQVQRELLRVIILLENGENDPDLLELHQAFVTQRMSEATLEYQLQTLGSQDLLDQARALAADWQTRVVPVLEKIMENPADDDVILRREAVDEMLELERGFSNLVAQGEINRKQQAGIVNDTTRAILDSERILLIGLGVSSVLFTVFMIITTVQYYRFDSEREASSDALRVLNSKMEERSSEVIEQRDFARQIMDNMGQGLTVVDAEGLFTYVNPAYATIIGEEAGTLIGRSPFDFTEQQDHKVLEREREGRLAGRKNTYETRLRRADGKVVDALITGVPRYRQETYIGSIAVITDLTEQKRVEDALRQNEAEARKLSQVASRTDNMVIISDKHGHIEWVNNAFTHVTGYQVAEVVGSRPGDILQGPETDPEVVAYMGQQVRRGEPFNTEVINYSKAGRPYWVEIEVQPVYDNDHRLTNFIAIETDITARREVKNQLLKAKEVAERAAQSKTAFLASMSHEIRTPLNAVIGLNTLLLNTELSVEQRKFAETARSSGNLLLMLINNVLDFSALESGRVELEQRSFNFTESIDELVSLLRHEAEKKGLTLTYEVDPTIPQLLVGDETKLRQILLNLVGNSIKFTESGYVKVTVSLVENGEKNTIGFAISDTGIGIVPERCERIFQPFIQADASTTRKYGGSGLGLAISKEIVNLMGGTIEVDSEVGQGTTVRFDIKLHSSSSAFPHAPNQKAEFDSEMANSWPLRMILVEDDPVNQQVAHHMLGLLGYVVDVVGNGQEALDAVRQRPYDIVFMDINMPLMDGLTATRQIRQERGIGDRLKIIAMTASALEGDRERFIAAGMDDYISKPLQPDNLVAALRRVISKNNNTKSVAKPAVDLQDDFQDNVDSPIDIESFQARMGEDQESLLQSLVDLFLVEAKRSLPQIKEAVEIEDFARVKRLAHHVKGSAAGASAVHFAEIAHQLEKAVEKDNGSKAGQLADELRRELQCIIRWQEDTIRVD